MTTIKATNTDTTAAAEAFDPILLEVIRGRLDVIANEMEVTLLRSSYSSLVKEALDATAALFDRQGRTLAQAEALPAHLGMLVTAMARIVRSYPEGVAQPGDAYILNDPYDGGTHLPDLIVVVPVFFGASLVGYTSTMCHHQDVGGSAPGSTAPNAVDVHAEGLRIPLLRLVEQGNRNETLNAFLLANTRVPANLGGDLDAQIAACGTGASRLREMCEEWGPDVVLRAADELMSYSERLTRVAISGLPDGTFEFTDYLDDDGIVAEPVAIKVAVSIDGSNIHFDFQGSSRQTRGAINCVASSTLAAVYFVVRSLTGPHIPNNAGCYRPVTVTLPEGSVVNARYPSPVGSRAITMKRVVDAAFGALAKAVPEKVPAASSGQVNIMYVGGTDQRTGDAYVGFLGVPLPGGMGARATKDGIDVVETDVNNNKHYSTEACEAELPLRINSIRLWTDSGGPGRFRGGLGYIADVSWLGSDALITIRRDRHKFAPWGLAGGQGSWPCRTLVERAADGSALELSSKEVFSISFGDRLRIWTSGGGGYGDPAERDVELVRADVLNGRVSRKEAETVYAVVLSANDVDLERTNQIRALARTTEHQPRQPNWETE